LAQQLPAAADRAGPDGKLAHTAWASEENRFRPVAGRFAQNRRNRVYRTEKPAKSAYLPCPDV